MSSLTHLGTKQLKSRISQWAVAALFILALILSPISVMAQSAKTSEDIFTVLKGMPGLSSLPVTDIKKTGNTTSAQVNLSGKTAKVVGFNMCHVNTVSINGMISIGTLCQRMPDLIVATWFGIIETDHWFY